MLSTLINELTCGHWTTVVFIELLVYIEVTIKLICTCSPSLVLTKGTKAHQRKVSSARLGTANRLHCTIYPSWARFSGSRSSFIRARTTSRHGPRTGEILIRHGWAKVVYTTKSILACARLSDSIRSGNVLKGKLRRARLGKVSGGGGKNGRESLLAFLYRPSSAHFCHVWIRLSKLLTLQLATIILKFLAWALHATRTPCAMCGNLCLRIRYPVRASVFLALVYSNKRGR